MAFGSRGDAAELPLVPGVSSLVSSMGAFDFRGGKSTSGMSGADAFPESYLPIGTGASLGCADMLRGIISAIFVPRVTSGFANHVSVLVFVAATKTCPSCLPISFWYVLEFAI